MGGCKKEKTMRERIEGCKKEKIWKRKNGRVIRKKKTEREKAKENGWVQT